MLTKSSRSLTEDQVKRLNAGKVIIPKEESPNDEGSSTRSALRKFGKSLTGDKALVLLGTGKGYQLITKAQAKTVEFSNIFYDGKTGEAAQKSFLK